MSKLTLLLVALAALLTVACSSQADIKFINRTSGNLYITVDGHSHTLAPNDTRNSTLKVSTDADFSWFLNETKTRVIIQNLTGETFWLDSTQPSLATTTAYVKADEIYKIYCDPNCAALRVVNNSSQEVSSIHVIKTGATGGTFDWWLTLAGNTGPGQTSFYRLAPATTTNFFDYQFQVYTADGQEHFGAAALYKDDILDLTVEDN